MHNCYYGSNPNTDSNKNTAEVDLIDLADSATNVVNSAATSNIAITPAVFDTNSNNISLTSASFASDYISSSSNDVTAIANPSDSSKSQPLQINISLAELISDQEDQTDLFHLQEYLHRSNERFNQLLNQVTAARMYYQCVMNAYR